MDTQVASHDGGLDERSRPASVRPTAAVSTVALMGAAYGLVAVWPQGTGNGSGSGSASARLDPRVVPPLCPTAAAVADTPARPPVAVSPFAGSPVEKWAEG